MGESWVGPRNLPGKRGRGAGGKTISFGIHESGGRVVTENVPDTKKKTQQGIIPGRVAPSTLINSATWVAYDGLVELDYGHFRVNRNRDAFARGPAHINGIEGFWGTAKVRLAKVQGLPRETFHLHLRETEKRYDMRRSDRDTPCCDTSEMDLPARHDPSAFFIAVGVLAQALPISISAEVGPKTWQKQKPVALGARVQRRASCTAVACFEPIFTDDGVSGTHVPEREAMAGGRIVR